MSPRPPATSAQFFAELFGSKAARDGEIIRRKVRDVERYIGREVFASEMARRGLRVIENAGQFIIFCNHAPIRRVVWPDFRPEIETETVRFPPRATRPRAP